MIEHHMNQNGMQRPRLNITPIPTAPTPRPMIMSIAPPPGVLVSMPPPTLITTASIPPQQPPPNQPKAILPPPALYRIEPPPPPPPSLTSTHHVPSNDTDQKSQQPKQQQQQPQQQQQAQQHINKNDQQSSNHNSPIPSSSNTSNVSKSSLANIKEKTPMSLVNELARYNKIEHVYRLTGEQGPAHKKIFTVTLKLGKEDYEADGLSIKKAQHAAAAKALTKTELKHPPMKSMMSRPGNRQFSSGVTPTVKLNALAMKRGERAVYVIDNTVPPPQGFYPRHGLSFPQNSPRFGIDSRRNVRGHHPFENRYYGQFRPTVPPHNQNVYSVRLLVGEREYQGTHLGLSEENNKLAASSQSEKLSDGGSKHGGFNIYLPKCTGHGSTIQAAKHDAASKAIDHIKQLDGEIDQNSDNGQSTSQSSNSVNNDSNSDLKSPISLVYEIALKRNLNVHFEVLDEKGPPHMKVFVTQCKVGNFISEGEGNGKKISKKRAAEKILEELTKLPPLTSHINIVPQLRRKRLPNKKKTRNLIKVNVGRSAEVAEDINPISRLIQIQQANKEREPMYTVLEERGAPRRREFVIEAAVNGRSCTGVGPNKKVAKRNAADALLVELGYTPSKSILQKANKEDHGEKNRKVTFVEDKHEAQGGQNAGGSGGRQLVPGVLLVSENASFNKKNENAETPKPVPVVSLKAPPPGVRSKDKLLYLAELLNIEVQFSDFPKANHEVFLTLVSLGTTPPQVCHGEGPSIEESHDKASMEALKVLSELGLDIAVKKGNGNQTTKE